ncbi:unnamed protein product [Symbiodinium natans]|uniref:Uncharacterized protein n=1 Tax=Symbiodinium natans TaxID=878477 RepID=A0A812IF93_9DINO|nr:unnamed protein product [Symbiodinium natans]
MAARDYPAEGLPNASWLSHGLFRCTRIIKGSDRCMSTHLDTCPRQTLAVPLQRRAQVYLYGSEQDARASGNLENLGNLKQVGDEVFVYRMHGDGTDEELQRAIEPTPERARRSVFGLRWSSWQVGDLCWVPSCRRQGPGMMMQSKAAA